MRPQWNIFVFLAFVLSIHDTVGLRNVYLDIDPRIVRRGESSTLRCSYDLDGAPLYSVKWYRGIYEFYRYTPKEHPSTKIFPFPGIHVDLELSNEHQVVLRRVGFNLSGNFSCEVSADAPSFSTALARQEMLVVVLPESAPTLTSNESHYEIGDILRANCTSPPSRPPATLKFLMNNVVVCEKCKTRTHLSQDLWWSELSLELPLFPSHFSTGRLTLRCVAQVDDLYQQDAEVRLDKLKDPVPERVTSNRALRLGAPTKQDVAVLLCFLNVLSHFVLILR